jgi:hypothetical protein
MSSNDAEFVEQPDRACYGLLAALLAMVGQSKSVLMHKFRTQHLLSFQRENPRGVEWILSFVCARQEMERYPALLHLKYSATRSSRQRVQSVSACAQLDGKVLHENVAVVCTHIECFEINNNPGCLGRNIEKDSNVELSRILTNSSYLIRPDFEFKSCYTISHRLCIQF